MIDVLVIGEGKHSARTVILENRHPAIVIRGNPPGAENFVGTKDVAEIEQPKSGDFVLEFASRAGAEIFLHLVQQALEKCKP
jgi:hypothetical protein